MICEYFLVDLGFLFSFRVEFCFWLDDWLEDMIEEGPLLRHVGIHQRLIIVAEVLSLEIVNFLIG